ncbi:DUF3502 domain-containing protein [Paenibacillus cymbidii]|uniref:DUF3502 domain-containing protein n=1 Tax=Paenibacillus cymbidii TaxID=1639034 RepID=UPI001436C399|nr:DUF3502 domain-containing protein [Paenibacillus cymbidii]
MNKRIASTRVAIASVVALSLLLSACSKNESKGNSASSSPSPSASAAGSAKPSDSGKKTDLPPVELSWYLPISPQKDTALVEAEINKYLKDKINATIKLNFIDFGAYESKMNTMTATGEVFDMAWTANWGFDFTRAVAKGSFAEMDELLPKYAPELNKKLEKYWNAIKIDNKIYGIPFNLTTVPQAQGVVLFKDLVDKYKFDTSKVKSLRDLEPFYDAVLKNEKDVTAIGTDNTHGGSFVNLFSPTWLQEGAFNTVGIIRLDDPNLKIVNQYDQPEVKEALKVARDWYQKGYFKKDVLAIKDPEQDFIAGKYASNFAGVAPGWDAGMGSRWKHPLVQVYWENREQKPLATSTGLLSSMTAISKTSKNKERAMMFLNLVNTDPVLYNLLGFGIEGKHYKIIKKVGDRPDQVLVGDPDGVDPKANGYSHQLEWMFGDPWNAYQRSEASLGVSKLQQDWLAKAQVSPIFGWNFNGEKVADKLATVATVVSQYWIPLSIGAVDPDVELPKFLEKLKNAGADAIIAEKQKQLDAWKATQKK